MKKTNRINFTKKISEVSKQIEEVKITCFYMLSTDLYKIDNNNLTEIIIKKFENHPATIMTLIATDNKKLFQKKHKSWKIPKELRHLKSEVDEKTNYYLDLYFTKLENAKQNYLSGAKSNQFVKFVFAPLIELSLEDELHFFFVTLTIFQNGSIIIELFEDLIMLFIVSSVSVLQIVDIFTNNIKILSISALITILLAIGILMHRNHK